MENLKEIIALDLANPLENWRNLLSVHRFCHIWWDKGRKTITFDKNGKQEDIPKIHALVVDELRKLFFPMIPQPDDTLDALSKKMEKTMPPKPDEIEKWNQKRNQLFKSGKLKASEPQKALCLVEDQAYLVWTGEKSVIITPDKLNIHEPVYLIDKRSCYGILELSEPEVIENITSWKQIKPRAKITDVQLWSWWRINSWGEKLSKPVYAYKIKKFEKFDPPKMIEIPLGCQTIFDADKITWTDEPWSPPVTEIYQIANSDDYILFLGTKGLAEESSEKHKYYTSILIKIKNKSILVDYGELIPPERPYADAVIITQSNSDHFSNSILEFDVPVYMPEYMQDMIDEVKDNFFFYSDYEIVQFGDIQFKFYPIFGCRRTPAYAVKVDTIGIHTDFVGFKSDRDKEDFYKDLTVAIIDGTCVENDYIGYDANLKLPYGHASIRTQIENIPDNITVIIAHHGKETIDNEDRLKELIKKYPNKKIYAANDSDIYTFSQLKESFDPARAMMLANKLSELEEFVFVPNFIELTGSFIYAKDHEPRDIDIILRAFEDNNKQLWYVPLETSFFLKLNRSIQWATKELFGDAKPPSYPPPNPFGASFPSIPLADLVIRFKKPELKIPYEPTWQENVLGKDFKESVLEAELKVKDAKELEKQAKQSLEENKIELFRFYFAMKPIRPPRQPEKRLTVNTFLDMFSDEDYNVGIYVSEKRDGFHVIVFKNDEKVQIFTEDGSDITNKLPSIVDAVKKLPVKTLCVEGETEAWQDGQHLPREAAIGLARKGEDKNLILNLFDCLYHEEGDIHNKPYSYRWELLSKLPLPQKDGILDEKIKINVIPHVLCHNREKLKNETEKLRSIYASEGVVTMRADSTYSLSGRPLNDTDMVKFHNNVVFKAIVIEPVQTKSPSGTIYNLTWGIYPGSFTVMRKDIEEANNEEFYVAGKTFASPFVKRGMTIEIEAETINLIYREDKKFNDEVPVEFSAWAPRFVRELPGEKPNTIDEVIELAKKENHVFQGKRILPDKTVVFFEESAQRESENKEKVPENIAFYTNGESIDSEIVSPKDAKYIILFQTSTYHYLILEPGDTLPSDAQIITRENYEGTVAEYLNDYGFTFNQVAKMSEAIDPHSIILNEDKTYKFIFQSHWRVGLHDILKEIGREDLWREWTAEEWAQNWDSYWNEVSKILEQYFDEHPKYTHSPSFHLDFRYMTDEMGVGWTLLTQITDKPRVPPLRVYKKDGKYSAEEFELDETNFKIGWVTGEIPKRIKKGGAVAPVDIMAVRKAGGIPPEWFTLEDTFPPQSIPATKEGYAVMRIIRSGIIETGYLTSYAKEYFLTFTEPKDLPSFRWRVMFRYLRKPFAESELEEIFEELKEAKRIIPVSPEGWGKEEAGWLMIIATDPMPYYLSDRAVKLKRLPPFGYSGLPKYIRKQIPKEYHYWEIKDDNERLQIRDDLVMAIKKKQIVLKESVIKDYSIKFHYSDPERAIKRKTPAQKHYDIYIPITKRKMLHIITELNPIETPATPAYIKEPCTGWEGGIDWFNVGKNKVEKFESGPGSFGKEEAGYMAEIDRGRVSILEDTELFKKFEFKGKRMKGIYIMYRSDPSIDIWSFEKSELP